MLGAWEVRREVWRVEEMSNHLLRELGVGFGGQGSVVKDSSAFPTAPRSRRAQCGVGGGSIIAGGFSVITHGTWSEPVEGRGVSHEETRVERAVFATNYCDRFSFFFFFLISLIYCFYRGKTHNCAHPTVLGTRVLGWNVSHVDQNLQLQSFPLSPS